MACCQSLCGAGQARHIPTAQSPSAIGLYRLSLTSDQLYAYTGQKFITTWRDDGVVLASAMLYKHMPPALDSTTYTAPNSARGRVILEHRRTRQLWTFIPQRNVVIYAAQPPSASSVQAPTEPLNALLKNYALSVDPKPVFIAGRKTYKVTVRSKQPYRPFSKLWIDPYTGIVLRREIYHSDSSLSSVAYFSEIDLDPTLTSAVFSPSQWSSRRPREVQAHAPGDLDEIRTDLDHLPKNYTGKVLAPKSFGSYALQSSTLLQGKSQNALHLLYTDGLNQVSVYESSKLTAIDSKDQVSDTVSLNPSQTARVQHEYTYTVLTWATNGMQYSVVADLSVASLQHFAAALLQTHGS